MMNQEQIQLQAEVDMLIDGVPLEDLTLSQLFAEADRVGDKYLTTEEIQARETALEGFRIIADEWFEQWSAELASDGHRVAPHGDPLRSPLVNP